MPLNKNAGFFNSGWNLFKIGNIRYRAQTYTHKACDSPEGKKNNLKHKITKSWHRWPWATKTTQNQHWNGHCFGCSPNCHWPAVLQAHTACSSSPLPAPPSPVPQGCFLSSPCLDSQWGLFWSRCRTLHLLLLTLMRLTSPLVQLPLEAILALWHINGTTQLSVVCKPAGAPSHCLLTGVIIY